MGGPLPEEVRHEGGKFVIIGRDNPGTINIGHPPTSRLSPKAQDIRRNMLARVGNQARWQIDESLHGVARISLGLEHRPDAVPDRSGYLIREHATDEPAPLSAPDIATAFDTFHGQLLILGAPGSGKTTALLDLAVELIQRAEKDESLPMPVMFHLASWTTKRLPIADWLLSELAGPRYEVPQTVARSWVAGDDILPLLDGLDEVAEEHRAACVAAINKYRKELEARFARLAICCRLTEYQALPQLHLQGAMLIQPLTEAQIDAYLVDIGEQVAGLRSALLDDAELRELATTPLLLNVMVLTYQGMPAASIPSGKSFDDRRAELLDGYVERMFARRARRAPYRPDQMIPWLSCLARTLFTQQRDALYLEHIQPDWLPTRAARHQYVVVDRLVWAVVVGLAIGLAAEFARAMTVGLDPLGLMLGLAGTLTVGLFGGQDKVLAETHHRYRRQGLGLASAGRGLVVALIAGPIVGVASELAHGLRVNPTMVVIVGLLVGPIVGLTAALSGWPSIRPRRIAVVETIGWSPRKALRSGLNCGMVVGLAYVLLGELVIRMALTSSRPSSLLGFLAYWLSTALWLGLTVGLISGLLGFALGGLTSGQVEKRSVPNQGIHRSANRAIACGLFAGLLVGVLLGGAVSFSSKTRDGLAVLLAFGLAGGVVGGLGAGLSAGLAFGLAYGGQACLSHLALRFVLWREGVMPLNYVRFLDYATERIFLRRVGGGYIFIHRLVQEHFAANEEALVARVAGIPTPRK